MQDHLRQRLQSLKTEYEAGQKMLADLEAQQENLRNMLLRISGAIQVLEEILSEAEAPTLDEPSDINNTETHVQNVASSQL